MAEKEKEREIVKPYSKSEIERLAREKARKAALNDSAGIILVIILPLSILASIVTIGTPGYQGGLFSIVLLIFELMILVVNYDAVYSKYYKAYLEELSRSEKEEK